MNIDKWGKVGLWENIKFSSRRRSTDLFAAFIFPHKNRLQKKNRAGSECESDHTVAVLFLGTTSILNNSKLVLVSIIIFIFKVKPLA